MIWGGKVSQGVALTPTFDADILRVTNAVLDTKDLPSDAVVTQLFVREQNGHEYLLTTFTREAPSASLNLEIDEEDHAQFVVVGPGTVHLTGHVDFLDDEDDYSEDESPVPLAH